MEPKCLEDLNDACRHCSCTSTTYVNVGGDALRKKVVLNRTSTTVKAKLRWKLKTNLTPGIRFRKTFRNFFSQAAGFEPLIVGL
jgi:hypothetical protein